MTNENKKTFNKLIFAHIFRKKTFKNNLEKFMSDTLNATSTSLKNDSTNQTVYKKYILNGRFKALECFLVYKIAIH